MKQNFDSILNNYLLDNSRTVNTNSDYYESLIKTIPEKLYDIFDKNIYLTKGASGNGNRTKTPWIAIFNKDITLTAQYGIYICYLFRSDMSGFYLTLNQGITTFKNRYGKDQYEFAKKVADYFRSQINDDYFSKDPIDLKVKKGSLSYGYESIFVISRFYQLGEYNDFELLEDLKKMKIIYDEIYEKMSSLSYDEIIENVIQNREEILLNSNDASKKIQNALLEQSGKDEADIVELTKISIPNGNDSKYSLMSKKHVKKIDYIEKAKKDAQTGIRGELLVLEYEKQKMRLKKREDLVAKVKWVSEYNDSYGYDIESFAFDESGKEYQIFIEVKTTESNEKTVFFVSSNEIETMNNNKEKYWIYRISNVNNNPRIYKVNGLEFYQRFNLKEYSYIVELKNL